MKTKKWFLFFHLVGLVVFVHARRVNTPPPQPVVYEGIIYRAPHSGMQGGIIEAYDEKTGTLLWKRRVYGIARVAGLEEDVQWVFIKSLSVTNGQLFIVNEANHAFMLDLKTREVIPQNRDMIVFETPCETFTVPAPELAPPSTLIETTVILLRLARADFETLAREGNFDAEHICQYWKDGKARLLAMPKAVAASGVEAIVKGGKSVTFPTEFAVPPEVATNVVACGLNIPVPSSFEVREVGAALQCISELDVKGDMVRVWFCVEYTEEPTWKTFEFGSVPSSTNQTHLKLDQPFFPTCSFQSVVHVADGAMTLVGGGVPTLDKQEVTCALLTARVVRQARAAR